MDKNIEKLQVAIALVAFENTLRSAANTVAYFGALFAVFGIIFLFQVGFASSWGALAIAAVLIGESLYIRCTRSARALWVSGMSFALFAAWLLGNFAIGMAQNDPSL